MQYNQLNYEIKWNFLSKADNFRNLSLQFDILIGFNALLREENDLAKKINNYIHKKSGYI